MRVNCTCQISTNNFRSALDADVVGGAFCPNQVNYVLQFDLLLLPGPFYAQMAVGGFLTQLTTSVYLPFGDLCVVNSCSYFVHNISLVVESWHTGEWHTNSTDCSYAKKRFLVTISNILVLI